ncbi:hypothetical protein [Rugamonas sp. DEMB1]|uniref:hypothetical protein n=1 Tax=Rugamonas sp. DEMB1 TaxID=3039386 RepID=UPI0024484C43|nr:hypothetical protein [Rugamonas sp. DEMB1]WGG49949.1 hypothetical protein QC826_26315 [Rugamonas sp. DEMB1]
MLSVVYVLGGVAVLALLVYSGLLFLRFKKYCLLVATMQGRLDEFYDIRGGEGGLNRFESEIFYSLMSNKVQVSCNQELTIFGRNLRRQFIFSYVLAAAGILLIPMIAYL